MTTMLTIFTVEPSNQTRLLDLLHDNVATVIRTLDGWISSSMIASADGKRVVVHSQWRDVAAITAMRSDARMIAYFPKFAALASFEAIMGDVSHPTEA